MSDLSDLMNEVKKTTDEFAATLPPDGDWEPLLFVFKDGEMKIMQFEMLPPGRERQHMWEVLIPNLIHSISPNPDGAVLLASVWIGNPESSLPPRFQEDKKEALMLTGVSKDDEVCHYGWIIRGENHPELEWETADGMTGPGIGALKRAVWS